MAYLTVYPVLRTIYADKDGHVWRPYDNGYDGPHNCEGCGNPIGDKGWVSDHEDKRHLCMKCGVVNPMIPELVQDRLDDWVS